MSISRKELDAKMEQTSAEIDQFTYDITYTMDDYLSIKLQRLIGVIQDAQNALVDYEGHENKELKLNPELADKLIERINTAIDRAQVKLNNISEQVKTERGGALIVTLNTLKQFESDLRGIINKDRSRLKSEPTSESKQDF